MYTLTVLAVRGEGAVHALADGMRLANTIAQMAGVWDDEAQRSELLTAYQDEMLERGLKAVRGSLNAHEIQSSQRTIFGQKVMPMPEKKVLLSEVPRVF